MDVNLSVDVILAAIKSMDDPGKAFYKIMKVAEEVTPSKVWGRLGYDLDRDIAEAKQWLEEEFIAAGDFTGVYLGLDTLNMDDGRGHNVEIGFSGVPNVNAVRSLDWLNGPEVRGSRHLIRSLCEMQNVYGNEDKYDYKIRSFAQYVIFLGYSGVVLGTALGQLKREDEYLAQWGYHDGDMFWLARKSGPQFTLIP